MLKDKISVVQSIGRSCTLLEKTRYLDNGEKIILVGLFVWLLVKMWSSVQYDSWLINGLYALDQMIVLVFCLVRHPAKCISFSLRDWLLAFGGSFLPLMVDPAGSSPLIPLQYAAFLMCAGIMLHLAAKLTLRRAFGVVAANRGVVIKGPYSLVRHPMYTGYFMTQASILLAGPTLFNLIVIATAWVMQLYRIQAEERFLSNDVAYVAYCRSTRHRVIPYIY